MNHTLLCDIGGTHARFARLVETGSYDHFKKYKLNAFQSFQDIVNQYCTDMADFRFEQARFSVARTPMNGRIEYKRYAGDPDYVIDFNIVESQQGWNDVPYLNDLEAAAYGVQMLSPSQVQTVLNAEGETWNDHKIIISIGTGIGHAGVMDGYIMRTCGGHFLPVTVTDEHKALEQFIRGRKNANFALIMEDFLSGHGMQSIAEFVTGIHYNDVTNHDFLKILHTTPAITRLFFEMLGIYAQTVVSVTGSYGGVYLTGGMIDILMANHLTNWAAFAEFLRPPMVHGVIHRLKSTSVHYVLHDELPLLGLTGL